MVIRAWLQRHRRHRRLRRRRRLHPQLHHPETPHQRPTPPFAPLARYVSRLRRPQWLGNAFVLDGAPCGKSELRMLKQQTATYITAKPEFREKALQEQRGDIARRRRQLEDDEVDRLGAR